MKWYQLFYNEQLCLGIMYDSCLITVNTGSQELGNPSIYTYKEFKDKKEGITILFL